MSVLYSDARADDLADRFDFAATPKPFQPTALPEPLAYFLDLPESNVVADTDF